MRRMSVAVLQWNVWKSAECVWDRIKSEIDVLAEEVAERHAIVKSGDLVAVNAFRVPLEMRFCEIESVWIV